MKNPSNNDHNPMVSFSLVYKVSDKSLTIQTVKVKNLPGDCVRGTPVFVKFNLMKWSPKTRIKKALSEEIIWNEPFTKTFKHKDLLKKHLKVTVIAEDQTGLIGEAMLEMKHPVPDENTLVELLLSKETNKTNHRGVLQFSVHYTPDDVRCKVIEAWDLPRTMRTYEVITRLLLPSDYHEERTTAQCSPKWNEEIIPFECQNSKEAVLELQVVGKRTDDTETLGEVRLKIADVKSIIKQYGRIVSLQEPHVASVELHTTFTKDENPNLLKICVIGLKDFTPIRERTYVYVQVKHIYGGEVLKKKKTKKSVLTPSSKFIPEYFKFAIPSEKEKRRETKLILIVKTKKHFYSINKQVVGKAAIDPFSSLKRNRDIFRFNKEREYSCLELEMTPFETVMDQQ